MFKKIQRFLKRRGRLAMLVEFLAAIAVWWGVWGMLDLFIFHDNKLISYLISIAIGLVLLLFSGSDLDDIK